MSSIAKRLMASIRFDAINGDCHERRLCGLQMVEAAGEIERLEKALSIQEAANLAITAALRDIAAISTAENGHDQLIAAIQGICLAALNPTKNRS